MRRPKESDFMKKVWTDRLDKDNDIRFQCISCVKIDIRKYNFFWLFMLAIYLFSNCVSFSS